MIGARGSRCFGVVGLLFPRGLGTNTQAPAAISQARLVGTADSSGEVEEALLEEAQVGGASKDGNDDDGINRV